MNKYKVYVKDIEFIDSNVNYAIMDGRAYTITESALEALREDATELDCEDTIERHVTHGSAAGVTYFGNLHATGICGGDEGEKGR